MKIIPNLTIDYLRERLSYDPETGVITWRVSSVGRGFPVKAGDEAGYLHKGSGYRRIRFGPRSYPSHVIAWAMTYGYWPMLIVDHKNTDRADNRLSNLRVATDRQNRWNSGHHKNNTSGHKGVGISKNGKWFAQISSNRKSIWLGTFHTKEAAIDAYSEAAGNMHGEFARY